MLSRKENAQIKIISRLAGSLLRLWFATCRVEIINREIHERYLNDEKDVIGATWHRGAIFMIYFYGPHHPTLLLSRSKDGEYLARFAERMGVTVIRGSSTRGAASALRAMIQLLKGKGGKIATVLDGPQGPRYVAKPGMIVVAQKTGIPIIPVAWSATRVYTFMKSWDRTMLPLPFSLVKVAYGDPIYVPASGGKARIGEYTHIVQESLNNLTREVDKMCGYNRGT
jgi:lysophospholipid acyltransferase (LPLAT)-like uncharacterized protein